MLAYSINASEDQQLFIFPNGVEQFAKEHNAEVIHIYDDTVIYFDRETQTWTPLADRSEVQVASVKSLPRGI